MSQHASPKQSRSRSVKTKVRPRRDFEAMKKRRLKAARMFEAGELPASVARALGVSCQAVCYWMDQWIAGGRVRDALHGAGRAGRMPRLTTEQMDAVEKALLKGATANGYSTDLWTLKRVAEVIERTTSVNYHPGHVWRLLRAMGWSRQKPTRRAAERDEAKIAAWVKETWPRVKKTPNGNGAGSSSKTSQGSRSSRPSAEPGLLEDRLRSSSTPSTGSGSRRPRRSATAGTASAPASTSRPRMAPITN
jgi:transposase